MASTRNINTMSDYRLHTLQNRDLQTYNLYQNSSYGAPNNNRVIPNLGYMPSKMSYDSLSNNPIDIESALRGIGSTNLVEPKQPVIPDMKKLQFNDWFDRDKAVIMPYPFIHIGNQRPSLV